jgi:hypothetical protein
MKLLIKFPTRNRKEQFFNTFERYQSFLRLPSTEFLITLDEDDTSMNNDEVLNRLKEYKNTKVVVGNSISKIHAVNRDINVLDDWDIILLASDDMVPQAIGYDEIICNLMQQNFPDTDGVLWFNDGFKGIELNTLSILGKKYYQRFGYIYFPGYKSGFCDNEFMTVGNLLHKQIYFPYIIIRHEHPDYGYGNRDFIHNKNAADLAHDKQLLNDRSNINFGL